jgi:hypothetical protein
MVGRRAQKHKRETIHKSIQKQRIHRIENNNTKQKTNIKIILKNKVEQLENNKTKTIIRQRTAQKLRTAT